MQEGADYFEYTRDVWKAGADMAPALREVYANILREQPSPVRSYAHMSVTFGMETLGPVASKYRLQAGDYVFGLLCEACLEVSGLEEMAVFYVFSGRNDAAYQGSAGFFPYRVPVSFRKDGRFFTHVGRDVLRAVENSTPLQDVTYRILCRNEYPYPYVSYNCLEMIGENGDFIFSAVPGEAAPVDKDARKAIPHADINCHIAKDTLAYVQVNYDPDFIPEEMMKAILGRASALAEEIMRLEFPGESGRP